MANYSTIEKQPLIGTSQPHEDEEEPSLAELQQEVFNAQRRYMRAWTKTTSGKWHKRIMLGVTLLLSFFILFCFGVILQDSLYDGRDGRDDRYPLFPSKVPLEAHIMSKCPDARDCLRDTLLPAMQEVSDMVDFRLSYIGKSTEHDDGVECKHGQEECLGNIIELCAAHLYPIKQSLGFTMCLTKDYQDIPERELVEDCALEHSISMEDLNKCTSTTDGTLAVNMLRSSFSRSAEANVTKSCTIRVDNEVWCVRDGGEWKDCDEGHTGEDLMQSVKALYQSSNW